MFAEEAAQVVHANGLHHKTKKHPGKHHAKKHAVKKEAANDATDKYNNKTTNRVHGTF